MKQEQNNEYAKRIIQICNNATKYDKEKDKVVFNEQAPFIEDLKNHLFNEGFEIQDFYYNTLYEAFDAIRAVVEYQNVTEQIEDYEEDILESAEADIYTSDLITWLSSDYAHIDRVDECIAEGATSLTDAMMWAQNMHKVEIYWMAISFIVEQVGE